MQGWGQLHENDYDYDYNCTMIIQSNYNCDYWWKSMIMIMIIITKP